MRRELDLFGIPITPRTLFRRRDSRLRKQGYAARPGTGPKRQFCFTCQHPTRVVHQGEHTYKCAKRAHEWRHDAATDIKHNAPACSEWQRRAYPKKGGQPPCTASE